MRRRRRKRRAQPYRTLSSSSSLRECFQASTYPEQVQGVQGSSLPEWGPGSAAGALLRQPGTGAQPQSVYIYLHMECPWCLFRHVDLSACLWVWSHCERILESPVVQSLCACMKAVTHTHTYTHTHTHTHRNNISSINALECHPFPDSEAEHNGCPSGGLKRCQCLTDVFLHAVLAEDVRVWECRISIQHCQRSRRLSHEEVFISDQMDCANYLFMSVFYNKHVCLYAPPPVFFLFVQEYLVTQMLPLSVTAQGTLLHFLRWCPPRCLWRPHRSRLGPEAPQEAELLRNWRRESELQPTFLSM